MMRAAPSPLASGAVAQPWRSAVAMKTDKPATKPSDIELHSDAWDRFTDFVVGVVEFGDLCDAPPNAFKRALAEQN
jgi:hypothetical protein